MHLTIDKKKTRPRQTTKFPKGPPMEATNWATNQGVATAKTETATKTITTTVKGKTTTKTIVTATTTETKTTKSNKKSSHKKGR